MSDISDSMIQVIVGKARPFLEANREGQLTLDYLTVEALDIEGITRLIPAMEKVGIETGRFVVFYMDRAVFSWIPLRTPEEYARDILDALPE